MLFKGSGVAICTPFTEDGINYDTFAKLVDFQIENGTDALVVCGTTGEKSSLNQARLLRVNLLSLSLYRLHIRRYQSS